MATDQLGVAYAGKPAVKAVSLSVNQGEVLGLIGPSGCGKTTLLRSLNRLVDQTPTATRSGTISLDEKDVDLLDVTELRRQVGMVFQQPNPFPMSVFDNVAYGLRERGSRRPSRAALRPAVEEALDRAGLGTLGDAVARRTLDDGGLVVHDDPADGRRFLQRAHGSLPFREIRSMTKFMRITMMSSTNAAAYAFCGAFPSPAGELL